MLRIILIIIIALIILVPLLLWLGLRIQPRPFPTYPESPPELATVPLPDDLHRDFRRRNQRPAFT